MVIQEVQPSKLAEQFSRLQVIGAGSFLWRAMDSKIVHRFSRLNLCFIHTVLCLVDTLRKGSGSARPAVLHVLNMRRNAQIAPSIVQRIAGYVIRERRREVHDESMQIDVVAVNAAFRVKPAVFIRRCVPRVDADPIHVRRVDDGDLPPSQRNVSEQSIDQYRHALLGRFSTFGGTKTRRLVTRSAFVGDLAVIADQVQARATFLFRGMSQDIANVLALDNAAFVPRTWSNRRDLSATALAKTRRIGKGGSRIVLHLSGPSLGAMRPAASTAWALYVVSIIPHFH